ncbi:hypothetical protein P8C59_006783 [Phyllachora maydis]|uniref:FAD synthase n=1 Tax=Phyllachora maydis TaxID=1825666 RepID=A0AAD9I736_9PEZI|nr:hypothetical protein P8C59_006783 [Phyllachora maydis]
MSPREMVPAQPNGAVKDGKPVRREPRPDHFPDDHFPDDHFPDDHCPDHHSLEHVARELHARVAALLDEKDADTTLRRVQEQVRLAMGVIDAALDRYGIPELSMAYNGGKDCLVLLVLILACLPRHFVPSASRPPASHAAESSSAAAADSLPAFPASLQAVYVVSAAPFPEVDAFVAQSARHYHLDVHAYALPMKEALAAYLAEQGRAVRAVFVGTRRTDPHGALLTHFDPTDVDKGWPAFMRVHPVIDWHYAEIWAFLRHLGIPYCSLYDQGYTSLGGTTDTLPNPALRKPGGTDGDEFRPAYKLLADEEERLGRNR